MNAYIVTLKKGQNIDSFYDDMETEGGSLYIPNRRVECDKRRLISRNTNYLLTDDEVNELRKDERVLAVELPRKERGIIIKRNNCTQQTSTHWDKSSTIDANDVNWGLLRCVEGEQRDDWGNNITPAQTGTIKLTSSGKNVDVVIVDDHVDPNHPEMAVNNDGSGGTRVNQINWYDYASEAGTGDIGANFSYAISGDHGMHVAGTVAGNTQGWARNATIYNISPYGDEINLQDEELFDYIRAFHNNKPINPETGRRNPTVANNSWGYSYSIPLTAVDNVHFRGVTYNGPFTSGELNGYGIDTFVDGITYAVSPATVSSVDADIEDAINDGIIMVAAAGNDNMKIALSGSSDYGNYMFDSLDQYYYNAWGTPSRSATIICVGAVDNHSLEPKASYSNCGGRVDIFAPGTQIQSSLLEPSVASWAPGVKVSDPRGVGNLGKIQGTSMASPQVCGVIACLLENEPCLTQAQVLQYLIQYSGKDQMVVVTSGLNDQSPFSLEDAPNRYLTYIRKRPLIGSSYPRTSNNPRPNSGAVFPRIKVRYK